MHNLRKNTAILLVLSCLFLASCAIKRSVQIDLLKPAPATFPNYTHVAITNRSTLDSLSFLKVYPNNLLTSRFPQIPNILGNDVLSSFYDKMSQFPRIKLSEINPLPLAPRAAYKPLVISDIQLKELAEKYPNLDAILSLEGLKYEIYTYGNVYKDQILLSNGKVLDIPIFNSNYTYKIYTYWRLYDLKNQTIAFEKDFNQEMPFYYDGYSQYDGKGYGNNEQAWQRAALYTGSSFATSYVPYWETFKRDIYQGENQRLLAIADNAELGKWLEAAEGWETYLAKQNPGKSERARIYYNLSVAFEVLGEVSYARELCENAYKLTNKKFYLERAAELKRREADVEMLNIQFYGK